MWSDEIVDEVRQARRAFAEAHDHDLRRMFDDLKRQEVASGRPVVVLTPKPAARRRRRAQPAAH